jgi:eukaryotic-like serine/threonine-protein kinase
VHTGIAATAGAERYQRIRQLGQGGMGIVYEVFDNDKQRKVALKTLRSDDPDLAYRLKREFRSLSDVVHPNLVELYDLAGDETTSYYTMELVDGVNFLENCRARSDSAFPFDETSLRDSLAQLFHGVSALHAAGKIHRDIKPSNVLVARNGRVVLVDFGLVSDLSDLNSLTLTAHVVGTAHYMAPEQAQSGGSVGEASDWYGVGVVLFEALTGQRPFEGSMIEVLRDKLTKAAPDPRTLVPNLPVDLAELTVGLLKREPAERPSGDAIAEALAQAPPSGAKLKVRSSRSAPAFGGRDAELSQLCEEFERVLSGGCRVVSVRGPSGIGKSALVREFLERASQRANTTVLLGGRCYPREAIPYKAVDGVIDQLSEYWRRLSRADAMYLLPRELEFLTLAFPVLKRVKELTENALVPAVLEPQEARSRAVGALKETLQRLCRRVPLVLFLDDMQWVDADSTRLLRSIVDSADAPALLLLLASRSIAEHDPVNEWIAPLLARARVLELAPLADADTRAMIRRIASSASEETVAKMARDAAGSPFFAEALARNAGRDFESSDTPDLEALLAGRVGEHTELGQCLMRLASIAGQPLSVELAARASSASAEDVRSELRGLHAEALTREGAGAAAEQFEVYHDRIREAVLAALDGPTRQGLHRALALALEQEAPLDHEACCRHFLAGNAERKAMVHAAAAAAAAETQLAFDRAARYFALCLTQDDLPARAKCQLRARLAGALANAGRGTEAAHEFLLAAELAEPDAGLRYEWRAAEEFLRAGHSAQGVETAQIVVRKLGLRYPKHQTGALLAGAFRHARNRLASRGARVREFGAESEPLLRQIDVCAGIAQCIGYVAPAMSYYFQSLHVGLAFQVGEPVRLCRAFCIEATYAAIGGGERVRTEQLLSRAREISSKVADPKARGIVSLTEGTTAFFRGNWQQAFERCASAEELLKRECTGVQWEIDTALLYALSSLHYSGRIKQLCERVRPLAEAAESRRDMYGLTILRAGLSHVVHLAEDAPDEVLGALDSVMHAWPREELSVPRYWDLMSRFHVHLYRGTPEPILSELRERRRQIDQSLPMKVQVTRVRIALARGRSALAVAALGKDREENVRLALREAELLDAEKTGWVRPLADSLRAGAAAVEGRKERAIELLERAARGFDGADMGLEACVARRRHGELSKGSEGSRLVAEADQWMARQSIRNPVAFARVMAPGFPES